MKLISLTLSNSKQELIGDALRSVVDWVDACLLVDTGIKDDTITIAREVAGSKLIVHTGASVDGTGVTSARNSMLALAHELGFDWACMLDTDERMNPNGLALRRTLSEESADVLSVRFQTGEYYKERFFRLPARGQYVGLVHEMFQHVTGVMPKGLPTMTFIEIPKTPSQQVARNEWIVETLRKEPFTSRNRYYIGESLYELGRKEEAIEAYLECYRLRGHPEESCAAAFRAAVNMIDLGRYAEAIALCAEAMTIHAGIAELPLACACASLAAGDPKQAVYWATLATAWGEYRGNGKYTRRAFVRYVEGLYEKPFEVLAEAFTALGEVAQAKSAQGQALQALRERIGKQ